MNININLKIIIILLFFIICYLICISGFIFLILKHSFDSYNAKFDHLKEILINQSQMKSHKQIKIKNKKNEKNEK